MSIALPSVSRILGRPGQSEWTATLAARDRLWPRLLAHFASNGIEVAIERSDRRLSYVRRLPVPAGDGLAASLKEYVASTGEAVMAAAIVVDGLVAAGRFQPRASARSSGVESLRNDLCLHLVRVVDERTALGHSVRLPASNAVQWVLPPRMAPVSGPISTAVCRMSSDARPALLAPVGGSVESTLLSLLSHPFAPVHNDELIVVTSMRARGLAPVFGNLLGTDGVSRAFEALAGIDYDCAFPLAADGVVSLAVRDDRARRACAVICAAVSQMCALLSFDGVRRVLLSGPAATLLAPLLARYPVAQRLRSVRAEANEAASEMEVGVLFTPIHFLEGARAILDQTIRALCLDVAQPLQARVSERYAHLTPHGQRVADVVLDDASLVIGESLAGIAGRAGVSTSQVSRFCRSLGFSGLIEFKLALVASRMREASERAN